MPRQIGWSNESNLLYNISQQLDRLAAVTAASGGGGGGTTNYLPKFTDATTLGNSLMREGGFGISISAAFNTNWAGAAAVLQVGNYAAFGRDGNGYTFMSTNAYNYTASSFRYMFGSLSAAIYNQEFGRHIWKIAPNGTANSDITWTIAMSLLATGNLLLNGTTDNGQRLQVYGDTLLRGSGNNNTTTALTVQNSDGTNMWRFANDGRITIGTSSSIIYPAENINQSGALSISGTGLQFAFSKSTQEGYGLYIRSTAAAQRTNTTGDAGIIDMFHGFAPTSGNGTFHMIKVTGTINQTGGANGITRGLYVNPILAAAADWRSIEWSNNSGWGLYGAGTANNYLAGSLGIGSTSLTAGNFIVNKTITGGVNSYGIYCGGQVQSDVTLNAFYFTSASSTQASVFTISGAIYHFLATQGTV